MPDPAPTPDSTPAKPEKPWPDFPLYWHQRGYWMCKRQRREYRYEADPHASYARYLKDKEIWDAGAVPAQPMKGYLLADAINQFLSRQQNRLADGAINSRQFARYRKELEKHLLQAVPKTTRLQDFASDRAPSLFRRIRATARAKGLESCRIHVTAVRAMLDHAARKRMMMAPDYGEDFDPPTVKQFRDQRNVERAEHGDRAWGIDELGAILVAAKKYDPHLYAQILVGLNLAYSAADVAAMTEGVIDRKTRLVRFPRVKTGIDRIGVLWPETLRAIDASLRVKPKPASREYAKLLFLSPTGLPCVRRKEHFDKSNVLERVVRIDAINLDFKRMLERMDAKRRKGNPDLKAPDLKRHKTGFNTLRAMFRSLAVGAHQDPDAIAIVMGRQFARPIDEWYIRADLREKLEALSEHVRSQVFKQTGESLPSDHAAHAGPASEKSSGKAPKE